MPVPPWEANPQALPPGIVLAPVTPPTFNALFSNPRLATEPPYERLVLMSSRVHNVELVARAVLPNVAYVAYDWKNFTLQVRAGAAVILSSSKRGEGLAV